jgi:hypothetical protein
MDTIEPADELEGCSPNSDEAAGPVLRRIADELVRLAPSRTDPHAFHETKSDLVHELRRLALGLDQSLPRSIKLPRVGNVAPRNFATPVAPRNSETLRVSRTLSSCRHCLRRRAQQTRRHRLRLRGLDLLQWAKRQ